MSKELDHMEADYLTTVRWLHEAEAKLTRIKALVDDPGMWSAYSVRRTELAAILGDTR
jgi:hypothetical protein